MTTKYVLVLLISFIAFLINSCDSRVEVSGGSSTVIDFSLNQSPERTNFIDLVDSVKIISFENIDGIYLTALSDCEIVDDKIYVNDEKSNNLCVFDMDGKHLFNIGNKGKGPGEFLDLADFAISGGKVYILAKEKRAIIVYNINGEYLEEINIPFFADRFDVLNDHLYFHNGYNADSKYNFLKTSLDGEIVQRGLPFDYKEALYTYTYTGNVVSVEELNHVLFSESISSNIYQADSSKKLITYYRIRFPKEQQILEKEIHDHQSFEEAAGDIYFLRANYFESNEHFVFEYNDKHPTILNNPTNAYYFKNEGLLFSADNLEEGVFTYHLSGPIGFHDGFFISYVTVNRMSAIKIAPSNKIEKQIVDSVEQSLKNQREPYPFLVFYRLKTFL